jgi:hypothetical protein
MLGGMFNPGSWSAGHVHAYERSVRVFNNRPHECGPVHIVIGDGGNREVCRFVTCWNTQLEHTKSRAKHDKLHSSMVRQPALVLFPCTKSLRGR